MISYISGVVEEIEKDKVVVDNNGIGYGIFASQSTLEQIGIGEQVKIYTYFSVREDAMQLYGFLSRQELQLFLVLLILLGFLSNSYKLHIRLLLDFCYLVVCILQY